MPEITYEVTVELTEAEIRKVAERGITRFSDPIMPVYIAACRQWVEENPGYPDGTIAEAVIETVGGETRRVVERFDGKWFYAPRKEVEVILQITSLRVLHTPPTMRDHLHAIGLSDDEINLGRNLGMVGLINEGNAIEVLVDACREAERG